MHGKKNWPEKDPHLRTRSAQWSCQVLRKTFPKVANLWAFKQRSQRKESAAREYQDLEALTYKDASFDYIIMDDILQNMPNLDKVLREVHRTLAPSGVLFATFPFAIDSEEHRIKATRNVDGSINYLMSQEERQDRTDGQPAVVFQIPGWNILRECNDIGFIRAEFVFLCSPTRGMLASHISGVMILKAEKSA
ncbi:MAG: methyltransferase domain-containing protein [Haliea sp.]|nr:methyltransferase domain-containing protein [Haliea sp.]